MQRRDDIFGFTIGELSFLLLFSALVLFTLGEQKNAKNLDTQNQLKETELQLEKAEKRIAELETENKRLLAEKGRTDLKSKQTPSCNEIGFKKGFFGEFTIFGVDTYFYNGRQFNFNELKNYISRDLEEAKNRNCILTIKVRYVKNISGMDLDIALAKLEKYFYVQRTRELW